MIVREILDNPDKYLKDTKSFDYFNDYEDTVRYLKTMIERAESVRRVYDDSLRPKRILRDLHEGWGQWKKENIPMNRP